MTEWREPSPPWQWTLSGLAVTVALACAALLAVRYEVDHHWLSPGVRRSLTAALAPERTPAQISGDLTRAQKQAHTFRDRQDLDLARSAFHHQDLARALQQHLDARQMRYLSTSAKELHQEQLLLAMEGLYRARNQHVPRPQASDVDQAFQHRAWVRYQEQVEEAEEQAQCSREQGETDQLFHNLRLDLDLRP